MNRQSKQSRRRGVVVVLTVVMLVAFCALVALAVDLGYLTLARTQLQTAADASALAGAWDMLHGRITTPPTPYTQSESAARVSARYYATSHFVAGATLPTLPDGDITFGRIDLTAGLSAPLVTSGDPTLFNAVQVCVRRSSDTNGEIPLFFARVMGINTGQTQAVATAAFMDSIKGIKTPGEGQTVMLFPIALNKARWDELMAGGGAGDHWKWNEQSKTVSAGSDQILEVNLYPQAIGAAGNSGTIDIGNPNNSTADLSRQIRYGVNAQDLSYYPNGEFVLGPNGSVTTTGDTGISAGIKDDLASIVGQTRVIPLFDLVSGSGNNATYTIVKFVGMRIMAVNLTGNLSDRYLIIQPADIQIDGGVPGPGTTTSEYIYSKQAWLVR